MHAHWFRVMQGDDARHRTHPAHASIVFISCNRSTRLTGVGVAFGRLLALGENGAAPMAAPPAACRPDGRAPGGLPRSARRPTAPRAGTYREAPGDPLGGGDVAGTTSPMRARFAAALSGVTGPWTIERMIPSWSRKYWVGRPNTR
jgi:hypothetical protein